MLRFDLAKLASGKTRRREFVLPPITDSIGSQKEIERILRRMLREMAAEVKSSVLPAAVADAERLRALLTADAPGDRIDAPLTILKALAARLGAIAADLVRRVIRTESQRHTKRWEASVRRAFGIDLAAVIRQEDIGDFVEAASARAAALITGLSDETAAGVEKAVRRAVTQGATARDLQKELIKGFGIAERRAKVIARDQIATLNSDLNRIRHTQAGVTTYVWTTAHDERVRQLHRSIDGRRYKYGESTGAEGGLPPGQPIMCRCVARAVVEFGGKEF